MNADLILFHRMLIYKSPVVLSPITLRPSEVFSQSEPQRTEFSPIK